MLLHIPSGLIPWHNNTCTGFCWKGAGIWMFSDGGNFCRAWIPKGLNLIGLAAWMERQIMINIWCYFNILYFSLLALFFSYGVLAGSIDDIMNVLKRYHMTPWRQFWARAILSCSSLERSWPIRKISFQVKMLSGNTNDLHSLHAPRPSLLWFPSLLSSCRSYFLMTVSYTVEHFRNVLCFLWEMWIIWTRFSSTHWLLLLWFISILKMFHANQYSAKPQLIEHGCTVGEATL